LDELKIEQAVICGLSLGGVIAQLLAINHPERIQSLILINTFACLRPKKRDDWRYLLKRFFISLIFGKDRQAELVAERLFPAEEQQEYRQEVVHQIKNADKQIYKKAMKCIALLDIRNKLSLIKTRTLVITAEQDTTVAVQNQIEMAKKIQGARQVFIPNSRHAVIIDQPQLVNQEIIGFLFNL
jgi:pimeloyl-ACP methyl ester carboxylesterase